MYSSTILAAGAMLASSVSALPAASSTYYWSVTDFSNVDQLTTSTYAFEITGPVTSETPGFSTHCYGVANQQYAVCEDKSVVSKRVNNDNLFVQYTYTASDSVVYAIEGNQTADVPVGSGAAFTIIPGPIDRVPAKRDVVPLATFDCKKAFNTCYYTNKFAFDDCSEIQNQCEMCGQSEIACRTDATYSGSAQCTKNAQVCYHTAENAGSTHGPYGCAEAFATCKNAPMANNTFCAAQSDLCHKCEVEEDTCDNAPNANHSFCASNQGQCWDDAVNLKEYTPPAPPASS